MSMEHISTYTDEKSKQLNKGPRFVRWAVMVGIVVVLNLFFMAVRQLVFVEPQYNDFCSMPTPVAAPLSDKAQQVMQTAQTNCQNAYQAADAQYQLHSFILLVGLGVLAIIVGVLPIGSSIVSAGLSYGGVVSFIIASGEYWNVAGTWLKLLISVIALAALIYIGVKRFHD